MSLNGLYLVLEDGKRMATTPNISEATPLYLSMCESGYCIMSINKKLIQIDADNIINYQQLVGTYGMYIKSQDRFTYVGIVGEDWYLDISTMTFRSVPNSASGYLTSWKVVNA